MSSDFATAGASAEKAVIVAKGLSKSYRMYDKPSHRLLQGMFRRQMAQKHFWALQGVDLEISRGETVGIIGRNGSGKSTLLQMIAGTVQPSAGSVEVQGRVAALLELGSGFNPEFTGRENVYLNATILGLTRAQIDERIQSILNFADIGEFIDQPVRSYSSGMAVRLAFAVIVHVDADILIVDEALSVGDAFFSQKCMRFLREFQKKGTLLFVSHDAGAVVNLCTRAIWLEEGKVREAGVAREVVESYMAQQHAAARKVIAGEKVSVSARERRISADASLEERDFRHDLYAASGITSRIKVFEFDPETTRVEYGAGKAKIELVEFLDENGVVAQLISGREIVTLRISVRLLESLTDVIVGFYIKDRLGQRLFGDNTYLACIDAPVGGEAGELLCAEFRFRMPVMPSGSYMVDAAVASGSQDDHTQQHWVHDALEFRAIDETMRHGLVGIPILDIKLARGAL